MTRAVLLTFLTLCSARVSLVKAAAPPPPATCVDGQTTVTKVDRPGARQIQCPNDFQLAPPVGNNANQMQVFAAADAQNPVDLGGVLPGATYLNVLNHPTLTVPQLPAKNTSVFFRCRRQAPNNNQCVIQIDVAASPPLGPNTCAAVNSRVDFQIKAAAEAVTFRCGDGLAVFPQGGKALDESCSKEQSLPSGVALAAKDDVLVLGFAQLPQNALKICYICTAGGVQAEKAQRCEVHIAVAGSGNGGIPEGNGAAHLGTAARSASALALALITAGFLHIC